MTDIGPGDIVVYIAAKDARREELVVLIQDARYRIRKVGPGLDRGTNETVPTALLEGVLNPRSKSAEWGYRLDWFRPLRKSDSEEFRKMVKLPKRVTV